MADLANFGKYQLLVELGHGGMADVFLAAYKGSLGDKSFNKLLVIKRLRANLVEDPDFVSMLLDEGRLAARLNHPNVIQTYEIGEQNGVYFIAMEFLEGQPMNRLVSRNKARGANLTAEYVYSILADVLSGLHHAHELLDFDGTPLGVVHRDVSPQNIFITYAGQTKVVDFGIAKAVGRAAETREGVLKGKITYMAPEQLTNSKDVDRRADIFAVGLMLWEAATGERMWKGLQDVEIVQRLIAGQYEPHPKAVNPAVPAEVDAIISKALAFKRDERHATAAELQMELEGYLRSSGKLVTGRELGQFMVELFADKRAELKSLTEKQLTRLATLKADDAVEQLVPAPESATSLPKMEVSSSSQSRKGAPKLSVAPTMVSHEPDGSETMMGTVSGKTPKRSSRSLAVGIVAGVLGLCGIATALVVSKPKASDPPPKPVATDSPSASTSVSTTSAGPLVELSLRADPLQAQIFIDDGPALPNPYHGSVPRDGATHIVRAKAAGYKERAREVTFATEVVLDFPLEREAKTVVVPSTATAIRGERSDDTLLKKKKIVLDKDDPWKK